MTFALSKGQKGLLNGEMVFLKSPLEDQESQNHFANELTFLGRLKEIPGILQPIGFEDDCLVFPFIEHSLLTTPRKLDVVLQVLVPLLNVLAALEANKIIHGDIKLENVRVLDDDSIVLADFGKAKSYETFCPHRIGSISQHHAPDMTLTTQFDLYSVGVLAYQLLVGPHFMRDFVFPGRPIDILRSLPGHLRDFILRMTEPSALDRCQSVAEALEILQQSPRSDSVQFESYQLAARFEICLSIMKATFSASSSLQPAFDDFVGDHGCQYHARLKSWLERADCLLLHLRVGNRIVGAIEAAVDRNGQAQISTLFVDKRFRRNGFARKLEEKAVEFFKSRGHQSLVLNVAECNTNAISYYQSQGWIPISQPVYSGSIRFQRRI